MYRTVDGLSQPFLLLCLLTVLTLGNLWRRRRETRGGLLALSVPVVLLMLTCTRAVAYLALG